MDAINTRGEVVSAWFGKIPVVKRENCDAVLHQLLLIVLHFVYERRMIDGCQRLPAKYAGPSGTPLMGLSLSCSIWAYYSMME